MSDVTMRHPQEWDVAQWYSFHSWCDGSSDQSLMAVPLAISCSNQYSTTGVIKGNSMNCPVCEMVYIKDPLLLSLRTSLDVAAAGILSLSEWSFTMSANKIGRKVLLNKTFPSLEF